MKIINNNDIETAVINGRYRAEIVSVKLAETAKKKGYALVTFEIEHTEKETVADVARFAIWTVPTFEKINDTYYKKPFIWADIIKICKPKLPKMLDGTPEQLTPIVNDALHGKKLIIEVYDQQNNQSEKTGHKEIVKVEMYK